MKLNLQKLLGILTISAAILTVSSTLNTANANEACPSCGGPDGHLNYDEAENYYDGGHRVPLSEMLGTWRFIGIASNPNDSRIAQDNRFDPEGIKNPDFSSQNELEFCNVDKLTVNELNEGKKGNNSGPIPLFWQPSLSDPNPFLIFRWSHPFNMECQQIAGSTSEMICGLSWFQEASPNEIVTPSYYTYYVKN